MINTLETIRKNYEKREQQLRDRLNERKAYLLVQDQKIIELRNFVQRLWDMRTIEARGDRRAIGQVANIGIDDRLADAFLAILQDRAIPKE